MTSRSPKKFSRAVLLCLLAATALVIGLSSRLVRSSRAEQSATEPKTQINEGSNRAEIADQYGKLPLSFEANQGQTDRQVKFLSRGPGYGLFLTSGGLVLTLQEPKAPAIDKFKPLASAGDHSSTSAQQVSVLRLTMIGANPKTRVEGQDELPGKINYLVGDDQDKWRTNIPTYRKVHYSQIYPNVDLVYYGNRTELEYDFVVAPGGDLNKIKFQIEGTDRISLDQAGNLILKVKEREVRMSKPVIYQLTNKGERREVKGDYVLKGREIGFRVKTYDSTKPLIIDPVLSYSTLLGSGGNEYAYGIAVDSSGKAYVTGATDVSVFPTTPGAFQTTSSSGGAFVTKLDATGTNLIYSTYLSGSGGATGRGIAVDPSGNSYITGYTLSANFPTANPIRGGRYNLLKTADGGGQWSQKNIGSLNTPVMALAIDNTTPSTIYAGTTFGGGGIHKSTDSGNTWTPLNTGVSNAFCPALVIDPSTSATIYAALTPNNFTNSGVYKSTDSGSTWISVSNGLNTLSVTALGIDPQNTSILYAGTQFGIYKTTNGGTSWVSSSTGLNFGGFTSITIDPVSPTTIYASAGGGGVFKTTNGGANWGQVNTGLTNTTVRTLAIDPMSPATIYAGTAGGGVFKSTNGGGNWTAINNGMPSNTPVNSSVLNLTSTSTIYIGTNNGQIFKTTDAGTNWTKVFETLTSTRVNALAIDGGMPTTVYAGTDTSSQQLNDYEAFVTKLNPDGSGLVYSTFLGGSVNDFGFGIALDSNGAASVAGETSSTNFPAVNAFQTTFNGCSDGFVTKLNAAGSSFDFSTYLGGSGCDSAYAIAADSAGNDYVTGITRSVNFPTASAFQSTIGDSSMGDGFVTKFNGNGTLAYSTYLGGNWRDIGYGIAADTSGNAYITGLAESSNFPTANPLRSTGGGVFVTKLNHLGSGLIYSTYLGSGIGRGIAIDTAGNAYIAGFTAGEFPTVPGAVETRSHLFKSTDGASHWDNDNYGLGYPAFGSVAVHPSQRSTLYAGASTGVFKSTNAGRTWSAANLGLSNRSVSQVIIDPITPSRLYAVSYSGTLETGNGVYRSTDSGNTWSLISNGMTNTNVRCLAIDPVTPTIIYAGTYGGPIYKTVDGGNTWSPSGNPSIGFAVSLAVDPFTPTTIFAADSMSGGGIFKSIDSGVTWQQVGVNQTGSSASFVAVSPITQGTVYASTGAGVIKSLDGGSSWVVSRQSTFTKIVFDPVNPATIYLVSIFEGVLKTVDNGQNWTSMNKGLRVASAHSLTVDPTKPSILYVVVGSSFDNDAFVSKINHSGSTLIYSTLLGGAPAPGDSLNLSDEGTAIAVDAVGNAYVVGSSRSPDFQVTSEAYQPFNRGFTDAFVSKLAMSYIISGQVLDGSSVPVGDAEVTLSDGASLISVFTESDGSYEFSHLREGGNFTVSAAKPHFTMAPSSQTFNNLNSNQTLNFVATATNAPFYTISGQVTDNGIGLSGVTVTLSGSQAGVRTTDGNGNYSFTLAGSGNYTVTPSTLGFSFSPASRTFNSLSSDQTADFTSTRQSLVVTNANNHGAGSLRQAILDANAIAGLDTIVFSIPGAGVHTINLIVALPEITDPVVIDATTQPGFAGAPLIELNGAMAGNQPSGFVISAGSSTIRGFVISRFLSGAGISLRINGNNVIQGNYIGIDPTGTLRRGNHYGINLFRSSNNMIGGTAPAARNVVSANQFGGININGSGNQVSGNFIGTNAAGTAELGNGKGVEIVNYFDSDPSINNLIGGTAIGAGNLISGNATGITNNSSTTVIQGNLIGTDVLGTTAVGNGTGIHNYAGNTLIGGTVPGSRNVISGNGSGVYIVGSQSRLQGNLIGTDITGTLALGNTFGGVFAGDHALIGGTSPEARNVISGNGGIGNLALGYNSTGEFVTVQGNYIGTDATGNVALVNPSAGVAVAASNNQIGGLVVGARNIISGNVVGVQIGGYSTAGVFANVVQGNFIGLNAGGNAPLPNQSDGVKLVDAIGSTIGGTAPDARNTIAFNGRSGVFLSNQMGNSIRGNSIFSNAGLGIDLTPTGLTGPNGVTANDVGDADTGANNLQNFPLLTSVISNGGATSIQGTLNSTPNTIFQIDFYSNAACDPSGNGEGARFFDTTSVTTDANGNATINFASSMTLASGRVITATATNPVGNTSEFSPCDSTNATGSLKFTSPSYKVLEDVGNAVVTVIRSGGSKGTLSANYSSADGTAIAGSDYTAVSGTVVFADGETSKTFTVAIADDGISEPDETLRLALTGFTDLDTMGNPNTATMIIQSNSTPLVLTMNSIDVPEGDSGTTNGLVTVNLSAQTGRTVTADFNTVAVSATSGVDFGAASGSLTFAPGVTAQTITVSVSGDTLNEFNETFRVVLSNPTNATIGNFSTVRILDDDPLRIDSVTPAAGRASGGQQIKLTGAFAGLSTVRMGGIFASWIFTNGSADTSAITVLTPAHAVGAVQIDLTPTSGSPYSKANAFAYLPTVFTDDTLVVGVTTAKAQHIIELRQAVDALRAVAGLSPAPWTDATLTPMSSIIKAIHILELRSYLDDAAGRLGYTTSPYTDPTLGIGFPIKRIHIEELRQRIRNIAG